MIVAIDSRPQEVCELRGLHLKRFTKIPEIILLIALTLICLATALPGGLGSRIEPLDLPMSANVSEIRIAWGPGDAGSLLEVAQTWSGFQQLDNETQFWIVRLWSPGMSVLEVPLIWLSHVGIPIYWSLLTITLMLWVYIFIIISRLIQRKVSLTIGILIGVGCSWDFIYVFREGLFYTEGIAYGLLLAGLLILTEEIKKGSSRGFSFESLKAAIFIGLSIFVRHVSDIGLGILIISIFLLALNNSGRVLSKLNNKKNLDKDYKTRIHQILLVVIIAFTVTIPWRLVSTYVYESQRFPISMAISAGSVGPGLWVTPENEIKDFWTPYGANWACKIDYIKCMQLNRNSKNVSNRELTMEAILSALSNPLSYLKVRGSTLLERWNPINLKDKFDPSDIASLLPLFFLLYSLGIFILNRTKTNFLIMLIWLPFILGQILPLLIIHYESRYFIPLKLLIYGLAVSLSYKPIMFGKTDTKNQNKLKLRSKFNVKCLKFNSSFIRIEERYK